MAQGDFVFPTAGTLANNGTLDIKPTESSTEWLINEISYEATGSMNLYRVEASATMSALICSDSTSGWFPIPNGQAFAVNSNNYLRVENKSGTVAKVHVAGRINAD